MSRVPFQLLELSIISAQDLPPLSKNLRTYAVAWVNPERKLRTRINQQDQTNPVWNDKFVYRVDKEFLNSDTSFVMIEIYALGWLRDTLVGSVRVLISNLIPASVRQEKKRFVALQIKRPSGRPQGILNMGVALLDNTMHSMPLSSPSDREIEIKQEKHEDDRGNKQEKCDYGSEKKPQLWRSMSDKTDLMSKQGGRTKKKLDSSYLGYGSIVNHDQGSIVNGGSIVNESLCNSDVGPSPSVVAAAVAAGLYPRHLGPPPQPGSSVLEDWTVEESSMEGLRTKIERWRMEIPAMYDHKYQRLGRSKRKQRRRRRVGDEDETGLFSCFGNALGCEFTIVCGSNSGGRKSGPRGYTGSKISFSQLDS